MKISKDFHKAQEPKDIDSFISVGNQTKVHYIIANPSNKLLVGWKWRIEVALNLDGFLKLRDRL